MDERGAVRLDGREAAHRRTGGAGPGRARELRISARPIACVAIVDRGLASLRAIRAGRTFLGARGRGVETLVVCAPDEHAEAVLQGADRTFLLPDGWRQARRSGWKTLAGDLRGAGADAVWAGWGAFAMHPEFVESVHAAGISFLGPSADAIRAAHLSQLRMHMELPRDSARPQGQCVSVSLAVDGEGSIAILGCREVRVREGQESWLVEDPPPGIAQRRLRAAEEAARRLATAIGFVGVGSVEFRIRGEQFCLEAFRPHLDPADAVTEERIGVDFVQLQLRIASGERLESSLTDRTERSAIQALVYLSEAEKRPEAIRMLQVRAPGGAGVRADVPVRSGGLVPLHFEGAIAAITASGRVREQAVARLIAALSDFEIMVDRAATTRPQLIDALRCESSSRPISVGARPSDGRVREIEEQLAGASEALLVAAALAYDRRWRHMARGVIEGRSLVSLTEIQRLAVRPIELMHEGKVYRVRIRSVAPAWYHVEIDGRVARVRLDRTAEGHSVLREGGRVYRIAHAVTEREIQVEVCGATFRFVPAPLAEVRASIPARVVRLDVHCGDAVISGQALCVLESMKTETIVSAPVAGSISEVCVEVGSRVEPGEVLLLVKATSGSRIRAADRCRIRLRRAGSGGTRWGREWATALAGAMVGFDRDAGDLELLQELLEQPVRGGDRARLGEEMESLAGTLEGFIAVERCVRELSMSGADARTPPWTPADVLVWFRREFDSGRRSSPGVERALFHLGVGDLASRSERRAGTLRLVTAQCDREPRDLLACRVLDRLRRLAEAGAPVRQTSLAGRILSQLLELQSQISPKLERTVSETQWRLFGLPALEGRAREAEHEALRQCRSRARALDHAFELDVSMLARLPSEAVAPFGTWLRHRAPSRRELGAAVLLRRVYGVEDACAQTVDRRSEGWIHRLALANGRFVLGAIAAVENVSKRLALLEREAKRLSVELDGGKTEAFELVVPVDAEFERDRLLSRIERDACWKPNGTRVTLALVGRGAEVEYRTFCPESPSRPIADGLYELHPAATERLGLDRLGDFAIERLGSQGDRHAFRLFHRKATLRDVRLFVVTDLHHPWPPGSRMPRPELELLERELDSAARMLRRLLDRFPSEERPTLNRIVLAMSPSIGVTPANVDAALLRSARSMVGLGLDRVVLRLRRSGTDANGQPERYVEAALFPAGGATRGIVEWSVARSTPLRRATRCDVKVVAARDRGWIHPRELHRILTARGKRDDGLQATGDVRLPPGSFVAYELDRSGKEAVPRAVGATDAEEDSCVSFGVISTPTAKVPEGMKRVQILSNPTIEMGALTKKECDRIIAAIDLAEKLGVPVEWVPVSSGARVAMDSGTETLDAVARVVARLITYTQRGGVTHVIVHGINVGAQSYFDALSTMLMHTRGALIMTPDASIVLTGRVALEASGGVAAEELEIGGFERIMGPNGQAHYWARDVPHAFALLYEHYSYTYVVPGERGPRRHRTVDRRDRSIDSFPYGPSDEAAFDTVGQLFDPRFNPRRNRPFSMRVLMQAVIDQDGGHLERWSRMKNAETAVVWDAHLGGIPVCLVGIESRNVVRAEGAPVDGPPEWSAGTLFPMSSKKIARALNSASGNRPVVILANLAGFDGSPESLRELQLEYGSEIARAVVNFDGPIVFLVVSRYHGGAYVVFSRALNPRLRAAALEGSFASVIGGHAAAQVVLGREVRRRIRADERFGARGAEGARLADELLAEKRAEVAAEYDSLHTVERARDVGSLDAIVRSSQIRRFLITELEKGLSRGH